MLINEEYSCTAWFWNRSSWRHRTCSDSIVLLMTRMNKIIEVDEANLTALAEPGVITSHLATAVEAKGLFTHQIRVVWRYPPLAAMLLITPGDSVVLSMG